jgi:hypothetical protein
MAAVSLLVVGAAILIGQNLGPSPIPSPEPTHSPSPPEAGLSSQTLFRPGFSMELPAVDLDGEWGTIRVGRGEDLGGYEDAAIPAGTFVIEFFVEYVSDRLPDQAFGSSDWALRPANPTADPFILRPSRYERTLGPGFRPQTVLGQYPARVDARIVPTEGRIAFSVPNDASYLELELVYAPVGVGEVATVRVRRPGSAPDPVAFRTPSPLPGDPQYVERDGLPITVIDSSAADDLFSRLDVCTNPEAGYSVTFPDDWYTNTEIGTFSACSWFTPNYFEVVDPSFRPDDVWIWTYLVVRGAVGYTSLTYAFLSEELTIDGRPARRVEYNPGQMGEPNYRGYHYLILLGEDWLEGPTLVAQTDNVMADDYMLARAVLDRIVASVDFDR